MKAKSVFSVVTSLLLFTPWAASPSQAQTLAGSDVVDIAGFPPIQNRSEIQSVTQVKDALVTLSQPPDWCDNRSCLVPLRVARCQYVDWLDERVNGQISGRTIRSSSPLPISADDLSLMRAIWTNCPVVMGESIGLSGTVNFFKPSCEEEARIMRQLGISNNRNCPPQQPVSVGQGCGTGCVIKVTLTSTVKRVLLPDGREANMASVLVEQTGGGRGDMNTRNNRDFFAICSRRQVAFVESGSVPSANSWRQLSGTQQDRLTASGIGGPSFDLLCR